MCAVDWGQGLVVDKKEQETLVVMVVVADKKKQETLVVMVAVVADKLNTHELSSPEPPPSLLCCLGQPPAHS